MNKDYVITVNTDTPGVFDALEEWLDDHGANWDALMTSKPTGDQWRKEGQPAETSLNAPARLRVVADGDGGFRQMGGRQPKVCMIPDCGCTGYEHP